MLTDLPQSTRHPRLQTELDFLFGRINYERTPAASYPRYFKLESMRRLMELLGNPQQDYGIIHVAGTKGKGSVCRMIAGALNASGIRTGVYSSPHIESIHERISFAGQLISDEELADSLETTRHAVNRLDELADRDGSRKNSFFEIITATALLHFQRQHADKVVLEVGLGGRLDSTNICQPELCVITNISLDHVRQLGSTVDKIAREKAGIIKPGIPVVSGVRDPLAAREIHETCSVCNSDLMELDQDFHYQINDRDNDNDRLSIHFDSWGVLPERHSYQIKNVRLNAAGQFQVGNAAIAIAAINLLTDRFQVSHQAIRKAMSGFSMIGRGEVLSAADPLIIVDMAHNVASVEALIQTLQRLHPANGNSGNRKLVFASSRDKDLPAMLSRLLPWFDEVIFTRFVENPRATNPQELLETARRTLADKAARPVLTSLPDPQATWRSLQPLIPTTDLLCVAGSAFLVAEMRPLIRAYLQDGSPNPPVPGSDCR